MSRKTADGWLAFVVERDGEEVEIRFDYKVTAGCEATWLDPPEPPECEIFNVLRLGTDTEIELTNAELSDCEDRVWEHLYEDEPPDREGEEDE